MTYKLELPDIGEGVVEAEIQKWFVAEGDLVAEDQPLVEVMTDKATVVIPSPKKGRVLRRFHAEGEVARVHAPLVELEVEAGAAPGKANGASGPAATKAATSPSMAAPSPRPSPPVGEREEIVAAAAPSTLERRKALAAPAVRALARELGVDINGVAGTGPGGRVTKADLAPRPPLAAVPPATALAPGQPALLEERVPLRGVRKRIAERMALSKRTAAHFTFVEQCDATELVRLKDRMAEGARAEGVKLTFLPFVVKAVVAALQAFPKLNASLDDAAGEIVLKRHYDIGIASATENGLLVPVVRGADTRSLLDLAREIERLTADAKAGRARPEDQGHSTFTITSLGALGGLFATPVLNHPEVGILGLHRIRPTPVVRDGQVVVRDVMNVSVTSDHRVVDGHEAAAFCYRVIQYLEDPNLLFLRMV
ncbi:MAG TPA: dihydrolipoamide acetyltransferase family protein [Anaeromyxobacteraceae bacterium]|nr:dihydrolipoamide acetyltransferase family protein [Anaeromyxobacteraceae bacterium]